MKKIFFLFVIVAIAYQSKAQQQFSLKPSDSLTSKLWSPFFNVKPADSALYGKFFKLQPVEGNSQFKTVPSIANEEAFYSTMLIVKVGGGNMPVAKLDNSGGNYALLVKKVKVINPLITVKPVTP